MATRPSVPAVRVSLRNQVEVRPEADYVLYWMIAARRSHGSFALDHALWHAARLGKPLLVLEPLRAGHRWASRRIHRFVIEGMVDQAARFAAAGIRYYPYVEPVAGAGQGLLAALASRACVVVTDEYPCFFLPRMVAAAAATLPVRLEAVDGNGLLPLRAAPRAFPTAVSFRRHLQKELPEHLAAFPAADPLAAGAAARRRGLAEVPAAVLQHWPEAPVRSNSIDALLAEVAVDGAIGPAYVRGGERAGAEVLRRFVTGGLDRYADERSEPDADAGSGLSPYLHFGHVGAHQVAAAVIEREDWNPGRLAAKPTGSREGWWGMRPAAEAFLDEAVTWRELGQVFCFHRPDDHDRWEALPDWARATLEAHAGDPRPHLYSLEQLAAAETGDELWNAAQRQLVREGRIHNYMRMLWGKKILEWSPHPRDALARLIELNNRYAIDGRDPNSYTGILWTLGAFDRPWGPEREIFGVVRYMSSANTARKLHVKQYLARYGERMLL